MTTEGIKELYTRLVISWPTIYRQNGSEDYNRSMMKTYYDSFRDLTDEEVLAGLQKWTEANEKAPSIKALINEAKWLRLQKLGKKADPKTTYQMEWIRDDDPEEWERRYKLRRTSVLRKCREARRNETTEAAVL